ncbi:nucleic acid/nucleotide deaminase domain-containing protein, partial [Mesonia oceanica]|uniref:nucleic acid/nucleotide deaminase domain-containing protein n=1 Tax=Mesonia oceanica TaxID=2687242 RepID=UPI00124283A3
NPDLISEAIAKSIDNYFYTRYGDNQLTSYQIARNSGEDTIIAIDLIVSLITFVKGIAKSTQKLPKFNKWIDDVLERKGKGARKLENSLLKLRKVAYGESELSKLAVKYRKTLPHPKHNGNIAIFEYLDDSGKITRKEFTTIKGRREHAEIIGMKWLRDNKITNEKVTKVYSELEPCSLKESMCKQKLQRYKNADIEYSYDYPGDSNLGSEIRRKSIKQRTKDIKTKIK